MVARHLLGLDPLTPLDVAEALMRLQGELSAMAHEQGMPRLAQLCQAASEQARYEIERLKNPSRVEN